MLLISARLCVRCFTWFILIFYIWIFNIMSTSLFPILLLSAFHVSSYITLWRILYTNRVIFTANLFKNGYCYYFGIWKFENILFICMLLPKKTNFQYSSFRSVNGYPFFLKCMQTLWLYCELVHSTTISNTSLGCFLFIDFSLSLVNKKLHFPDSLEVRLLAVF